MATTLPDTPCYLNGELTRVCDAKVSVLDRGFVFGDGIYEVVPVYGQRLFRFDEHMARLQRSLAKVRITNPHDRDGWLQRCRQLVHALAEPLGSVAHVWNCVLEAWEATQRAGSQPGLRSSSSPTS